MDRLKANKISNCPCSVSTPSVLTRVVHDLIGGHDVIRIFIDFSSFFSWQCHAARSKFRFSRSSPPYFSFFTEHFGDEYRLELTSALFIICFCRPFECPLLRLLAEKTITRRLTTASFPKNRLRNHPSIVETGTRTTTRPTVPCFW
jgi:hypothetical protein